MPLIWAARGWQAERRAAWHLRWRGWRIIARNWRCSEGELDLVASRWSTLLIVEVRSRPTLDAAWASVDRDKLERTMATAQVLIRQHHLSQYQVRYDLIGIDAAGTLERRRDVLAGWLGT